MDNFTVRDCIEEAEGLIRAARATLRDYPSTLNGSFETVLRDLDQIGFRLESLGLDSLIVPDRLDPR